MNKAIIIAAAVLFGGSFNAVVAQDEQSDAEYVVEQLVTPELFEVAMSAMVDIMTRSIELEFVKQEKEVSAPTLEWLSEQMGRRMAQIMTKKVTADYVRAYEDVMSPDGLAGLKAFLQTTAGQEFAAMQGALALEGASIGEKYAQEIAGEAVGIVVADIQAGNISEDTTNLVRAELVGLFSE